MLQQARRKHPDIKFYRGDMTRLRLGKRYDVITCLFSAAGFVKTRAKLRTAIACMADRLKPGGLLLLEPWFSPRQWMVGRLHANFVDQPDLKLARISISKRRGNLSFNDEHFLVASKKGIEYFVERLELGLFTPEDYVEAFRDAGLRVEHDKKGLISRGLYIGRKPTE
jgi:SAM-dependent methyltransferase